MLPKRVDKCPLRPECKARKVYQDETTGKLYVIDKFTGDFREHRCSTLGYESAKPEVVYLGEWFNKRTQRTRWIGPVRTEDSARIPPPESKRRSWNTESEWEFKDVHIAKVKWERLK